MPDLNQNAYKYYKTTYIVNTIVEIKSCFWLVLPLHLVTMDTMYIKITPPNGDVLTKKDGGSSVSPDWGFNYKFDQIGSYTVQYLEGDKPYLTYHISAFENHLPLKKWTITEVINRLLDVCEPIRKGEKPRFRLNGMRSNGTIITPQNKSSGEEVGQAYKFDKILAPQFSFTKQTLRECLQEIGRFIHGEPRLKPKKDEDGKYYFEVTYDMYAQQEKSGIYTLPYTLKYVHQVIDSYSARLDSNAENLVNQLDKFSGVIIEPYRDGAKTVRTENMYVRISEDNMIIPTQYPIYTVEKLEYVYKDGNGNLQSLDITPYLFERSIYDTQLSSYDAQYPYSKAYGLYFAQGNKNIYGLNFKEDAAVFEEFKEHAITNILQQLLGKDYAVPEYPLLSFRVTYTPFYSARIGQTKTNYKEFKRPATLIYNQAANVVESRYYGENLKGAIARIGNVELSLTYHLASIYDIPRAGQMYNEKCYISAVATEFLPNLIKCTIGLSRDFNRISSYIGINSEKRYSEISQGQAVERNTLYNEYIVVGDRETPDSDSLIGTEMMKSIAATFTQEGDFKPLTNACAWGTTYQDSPVGAPVNLPVISSAFGNSISFSWQYEDNYSAGAISEFKENEGVSGYFQNNTPYTDYYGRIYYYDFDLQLTGPQITGSNFTDIGKDLPRGKTKPTQSSGYISTVGKTPYILRKDNREALQVNFQIDFVTNREDFIIGSALASYCPAVRGTDKELKAKLYVFPTDLNKFTDHIEAYEEENLEDLTSADITVTQQGNSFYITATLPADGKSWAIVTKQTKTKGDDTENEQGRVSKEDVVTGGDLLVGCNGDFKEGQEITVYFTPKRNIFDKTVWKDPWSV